MEIWLDTANTEMIQKAMCLGMLTGVTTNPTILAAADRGLEEVLDDLLHYQEGPVTIQVTANDTKEMVQQGQKLASYSNRIIIKVPITENGMQAIQLLSRQGIQTMATVLFSPHQALLAALAGADYIAPYLGRFEKAGGDPWAMLKSIVQIFQNYKLKTKILCASIASVEHFIKCAEIGVYGVTVKDEVFLKIIENHPLTVQSVQKFGEELGCNHYLLSKK